MSMSDPAAARVEQTGRSEAALIIKPLRLSRLVGPSCRHIGQYRDESSSISSLVNFNSFTLLILLTPMLIDGALNDGDLCCCRVTKASTTTRNCEESEEETAPGQNLA
jgi:hypothetical protein